MGSENLELAELEELFENSGDELYSYLLALSRDADAASDLLQNVFEKFIVQVSRDRIQRQTALHYLKTMCRNEFYDLKRRESRIVPLSDQDRLPAPPDLNKKESNAREIRIVLMETLSHPDTPPDVARVLRMRLLQKLDVESICADMNKSRSTIQRLMNKGLNLLANAFRRAGLTLEELEG